jgi:hypothetical protein
MSEEVPMVADIVRHIMVNRMELVQMDHLVKVQIKQQLIIASVAVAAEVAGMAAEVANIQTAL